MDCEKLIFLPFFVCIYQRIALPAKDIRQWKNAENVDLYDINVRAYEKVNDGSPERISNYVVSFTDRMFISIFIADYIFEKNIIFSIIYDSLDNYLLIMSLRS